MTRNTNFFAATAAALLTFSVAVASAAPAGHSGANGQGPSGPGPGPSGTNGHATTPLYGNSCTDQTSGGLFAFAGRAVATRCNTGGA